MQLSFLNATQTVIAVGVLCSLLSACSVNGTYSDAREPDAAKLRFIANAPNATLDYYDAQYCEGLTTGMLNNMLMANAERRAGMKVAPPADTKSYLEIKLQPGKEAFLRVNTNSGSSVCGNAFNFTPQSGGEYELVFATEPGRCTTLLRRLTHINGGDVRSPLPMFETGLPACSGRSPLFPAPLPSTPQRNALIDAIIETSATSIPHVPEMKYDLEGKLDKLVVERKTLIGSLKLPDEYWAQYRRNLEILEDDLNNSHERALEFYKNVYRMRLQRTEDEVLEQWLMPKDGAIRERVAANDKAMVLYYANTAKSVALETMDNHLARMSQLDQQFGVCERFLDCWRY
ncbi:hypothetical protein [Atopomonas hussainii]|uniref:hypothetical protein n=1 Tax=Atopomonas hussainii TaxID=1429083 RepID=UPI0008FFE076|nr:hypothetical protein [Atopomonas hussainii]